MAAYPGLQTKLLLKTGGRRSYRDSIEYTLET
jgi:hypothetical protein